MFVVCVRVPFAEDRQSVNLQHDALLGVCVDARHLHRGKASGFCVPSAAQEPSWAVTNML